MKKFLNIAVFGISLNVLDQLKSQILLAVPDKVMVRWVNIADKNIDLLMINDAFFSSLTIQKILSHVHVQYLRLIKVPEKQGKIVEDTLSYPVTKSDDLREWLQKLTLLPTDDSPHQYASIGTTCFTCRLNERPTQPIFMG